MNRDISRLIFEAVDQTISEEDFERLQDEIERSEEVRLEYLRAVHLCESLGEISTASLDVAESDDSGLPETRLAGSIRRTTRMSAWQLAIAATILLLVSGLAYWSGKRGVSRLAAQAGVTDREDGETTESLIAGHATLRRSVDLRWSAGASSYREGDVLPDGVLQFDEGVAEIDFFCGATLIVEGPATLDVESDWSVRVVEGRLRANVPPAARGFVVTAAGSQIVDLGTEFALEVGAENARVEVIDGEVELRGGEHDGNHLITGQGLLLKGTQAGSDVFEGLSTVKDVQRRIEDAETERFANWKSHSMQLRSDRRLIAYYPIAESQNQRIVRNAASGGNRFDGQLVGPVSRTAGRFGPDSSGLEFDRPGSRVRARIDGEFQAFTFTAWARIDSLEHRYNALFMVDGYETGEPHWQIRDDGRLMFSVMVDDTQDIRRFNEIDQRVVKTAGLARVYYSEPIWDISKSGQWFHLAAVYDPIGRRVVQYVNGQQVGSEDIKDKFHITKLRIGPAEIGNWGQPFRRTPWFAVRNLNGTIDELAIFDAVLTADEIQYLYEQGKPLGY